MQCFRYFNFTSFQQIDELTVTDFETLMEAATYRELDRTENAHMIAWQTMRAQAKKTVGKGKQKLVYTRFKRFFDTDRQLRRIKKLFEERKKR